MSLIGNVLKPLAKSVLTPLGLTTAVSATDVAIHKKLFGSGVPTFVDSNEEMNWIMKIIKSLEESGLLIKDVCKTIKNEAKEQKGRFPSMLLGTLGTSLLGNLFTGKAQFEQVKAHLELVRIFNAASSFIKFRNKKVLSKRT